MAIGTIMTICGVMMFYFVQSGPSIEPDLREIKHAGTFIGLLGIGAILAGLLLYFINRDQPQIQDLDL